MYLYRNLVLVFDTKGRITRYSMTEGSFFHMGGHFHAGGVIFIYCGKIVFHR